VNLDACLRKKKDANALPFHEKLLLEHMTKAGDQASSDGQGENIIWTSSSRLQKNDNTDS
jgi:hypothetical protein